MSWRDGEEPSPAMRRAARGRGEITGRHVLIAMVAFFAVVIAVNAVFITAAARSFPGLVVEKPFKRGLARDFNRTLDDRAVQNERGWRAGVEHVWNAESGELRLKVVMADAAGAPVTGITLEAVLGRIVTDAQDRALQFREVERGGYAAVADGVAPGEWRLVVRTQFADGAPFEAERRFMVR